MTPLGLVPSARRRRACEAEILDELLIAGWPRADILARRAEITGEAKTVLEDFIALGLGYERTADGERRFDPGEVGNSMTFAHVEGRETVWAERTLALRRRTILAAHGVPLRAGEPPPPRALPPRRFRLRLHRRFDLGDQAPGSTVRLRLPLPIEDAALSDVRVAISAPPGAEVKRAEGRLDARLAVPATGQVQLAFDAAFVALPTCPSGPPAPLPAAEAALYARPSEGLIRVGADARALAAKIAGGAEDGWARVRLIWAFLAARVRFGVINYEEVDLDRPWAWILENGWSDCQLGSAFMATFCRALGMPARLLSGYVLDADVPYHHYWSEVWIDGRGWAPIDTMSWSYARAGRDPLWSSYFLGEVDYRVTVERLPRLFSGSGDVRLPEITMRLSRLDEDGVTVRYIDCDTGRLAYSDRLSYGPAEPGPA